MVQRLVGNGITYLNPTFNCASGAAGTFDVTGTTNLGLTGGLVMTTGKAKTNSAMGIIGANGPQSLFASGSNNMPGDPDLTILAGVPTYDACILEFDFVPDGDSLLFNYVFGSEEYQSFSCSSVNDVFAFYLTGPLVTGSANLALIPGTNIPVSINTTTDTSLNNPGNITLCSQFGPGSPFGQYYADNSTGTSIVYYGLTTVLTARAEVIPCQTYHIKLAIADGGDPVYDSGVFLQENSFRSTNIRLALNSSLGTAYDYLVEGCTSGEIVAKRNKPLPVGQTLQLTYTGTATRNVDYLNVPDSLVIQPNDTMASFSIAPIFDGLVEGSETIQVNVVNPCNGIVIDSIFFEVRDYLPSTLYTDDTGVCQGDAVPLKVGDDANFTWFWRTDPVTGRIDNASGMEAIGYPDTTTTYLVSGTYNGCITDTSRVRVEVEPSPDVNILTSDTTVCLREPMQIRTDIGPKWFAGTGGYNYFWAPPLNLDNPFSKDPKFFSQKFQENLLVLTAQSPLGCMGSDTLIIRSRTPIDLVNVTADSQVVKYGSSFQLNAEGADFYTWTPGNTLDNGNIFNPIATPLEPTTYTVVGFNWQGCRDTATVTLNIDYKMDEFIPTAFSPNGDGNNDFFRPLNLRFQKLIEFRVFNRWGTEVYNSIDNTTGWNGTYKGEPQPIGAYQYYIRVVLPDGKSRTYKGDVTLVR